MYSVQYLKMSIFAGQDTFSEVAKHSQKLMGGTSTLFDEIRLNCGVKKDFKFPVHEIMFVWHGRLC
jgi:hypothetical protein